MTTTTNTIRLHRVLRAPADRIYRAFLDPDAMVKWLPPHGYTGKVLHMDAKVGGSYRMSFTNFSTGHSHSFGGKYLELVPHERIRHTDKFDDKNLGGHGADRGVRSAARRSVRCAAVWASGRADDGECVGRRDVERDREPHRQLLKSSSRQLRVPRGMRGLPVTAMGGPHRELVNPSKCLDSPGASCCEPDSASRSPSSSSARTPSPTRSVRSRGRRAARSWN
jgi:uncharacterized protein YndB with AHSA1/START domain